MTAPIMGIVCCELRNDAVPIISQLFMQMIDCDPTNQGIALHGK